MRVSDLINLASRYLRAGIAAALFLIICFFTGYSIIYRKLLKGQKKPSGKQLVWWGILICYLCVVFGATLLDRAGIWSNGRIEPLFSSYKDAWVHFTPSAWRNIILNFCMFLPFGFWLPLGQKRLRRFWKISLAGFGFSFLIECVQLLFRRGIFELDDLLGNTVGTMIGYGLFALGCFLVCRKERTPGNALSVLLLQVPFLLTVAVFAGIFWKYDRQELGNHPYQWLGTGDNAKLSVSGENTFSTQKDKFAVYEAVILTPEEAEEKGERIFEALGTAADASETITYDETIILYSDPQRYHLWIDYQGGTVRLTDFEVLFPEGRMAPEPVSGAGEAEIRDALDAIGFTVPKDADFKEREPGVYQWEAVMLQTEEGIVNGTFTCKYYGEETGIGELSDDLVTAVPYKAYAAISEQEAYERILKGEFPHVTDKVLEIQIASCSLAYVLDSKGYYQPTYRFECTVNDAESQILIPAVKVLK